MTGLRDFLKGVITRGTYESCTIASKCRRLILEVTVVILLLYLFAIIINTIIERAYLLTLILIFVDLVIINIANRFI